VAGAHPAGNLHRLQVFVPEHTGPQLGFSRVFLQQDVGFYELFSKLSAKLSRKKEKYEELKCFKVLILQNILMI
jgi:hypothetical protein